MTMTKIASKYKKPEWFGVRYGVAGEDARRYLCRTTSAIVNSVLVPNHRGGGSLRLYDSEAEAVHIAMRRLLVVRDNKEAAKLRRDSVRGQLPPEVEKDAFYHWWFCAFKKRHLLDRKRRVICVRRP